MKVAIFFFFFLFFFFPSLISYFVIDNDLGRFWKLQQSQKKKKIAVSSNFSR